MCDSFVLNIILVKIKIKKILKLRGQSTDFNKF